MTSPSSSDRSERSSIYWGSDSEAESPQPAASDSTHHHNAHPPRPRLSSPRLFHDFFSNASRGNARLPPAPSRADQNRLQEFPQAFENVNRAIQTAHQAFQNTPVVDLTDSPPRIQASPSTRLPVNRAPLSDDEYYSLPPFDYSSTAPPRSQMASSRRRTDMAAIRGTTHNTPPVDEPAPKRRRIVHELDDSDDDIATSVRPASAHVTQRPDVTPAVEAVDLTDVNTAAELSKALSKQRQDAIQAQMKQNQGSEPLGRTPLSSYKCPVCMETPEDATSTICGHLFCHKCIIDTLRWSEEQRQDEYAHGRNAKGTCPVCRKPLSRVDKAGGGRNLVPLELKLTTSKRADVKGKGVVREVVGTPKKGSTAPKTEREGSAAMWDDLTAF